MNHFTEKKNFFILMMMLLTASIMFSGCDDDETPPAPDELIADYPLLSDAVDKTGINDDMIINNAPFQDGGVYCNPDGCIVQTPALSTLDVDSFTISVEFKTSESKTQPVWVIGTWGRWLGFYLNADGTVSMLYNNANFHSTTTSYSLNEWHTAKITYKNSKGSISKASIYLDDVLAGSLEVTVAPWNDSDTDVGIENHSNEAMFKGGIVRNFKVYNIVAK